MENKTLICMEELILKLFPTSLDNLNYSIDAKFVYDKIIETKTHSSLIDKAADYPIAYLDLSARAYNALRSYGYNQYFQTVADLLKIPTKEMRKIRGIGDKTLQEITTALELFIERHS